MNAVFYDGGFTAAPQLRVMRIGEGSVSLPPQPLWGVCMNVLVFASRKGGSGKSTLAAHLAAHVNKPSRPCLLIDDDPQGSLRLWNTLRNYDALPLKTVERTISDDLKAAKRDKIEWVFVDTPPNASLSVAEAIEAATLLIIPCRPGIFDLDAVQETISMAREARTPFAVVINGAPPKRGSAESSAVTSARDCLNKLEIPVWGGQITHRASYSLALASGEGAREYDAEDSAATEIARLWLAVEKSVKVIRSARDGAGMHRVAA
jgi:chromosome partitioning protein